MSALKPTTIDDVRDLLATAASEKRALEIRGGGTKQAMGRPDRGTTILDLSAFNTVIDYDPKELVLTVGTGAKLCDIEVLVAGENQMLAFEPFDHAPLFGKQAGEATIGGIVSANVAGSRRLSAGCARDHTLGFEGVSGRGEIFKGGGRVVKNVTGYDLPKLLTGSWGRLAALTAVTLKVLPRPRTSATVIVRGLNDERAIAAMAEAAGSAAEISGAAHCPFGDTPTTAIRVEGIGPSVDARTAKLATLLRPYGEIEILSADATTEFWHGVRDLAPLGTTDATHLLWRINARPSRSWKIPTALSGARWFYDWAGGLLWFASSAEPAEVRRIATEAGAHATLIRAPDAVRISVPALQPAAPGVEALAARVKAAFDPAGILDPHRFQAACPCRPSSPPNRKPIQASPHPRRLFASACAAASARRHARPTCCSATNSIPRAGASISSRTCSRTSASPPPRWSSISIAACPACRA
jgi:glycolate oxidase FAD binding subunit